MAEAPHKTKFIGQFHPSQFKVDERGFYTAQMHGMSFIDSFMIVIF